MGWGVKPAPAEGGKGTAATEAAKSTPSEEEADALETEIDRRIEAYWPLTDLREQEAAVSGTSVLVDQLACYMRVETEKTGSTQTASRSTRSQDRSGDAADHEDVPTVTSTEGQ